MLNQSSDSRFPTSLSIVGWYSRLIFIFAVDTATVMIVESCWRFNHVWDSERKAHAIVKCGRSHQNNTLQHLTWPRQLNCYYHLIPWCWYLVAREPQFALVRTAHWLRYSPWRWCSIFTTADPPQFTQWLEVKLSFKLFKSLKSWFLLRETQFCFFKFSILHLLLLPVTRFCIHPSTYLSTGCLSHTIQWLGGSS